MSASFGKSGAYYYWISRGVDDRLVPANRVRKSVGAENTFSTDLTDFDAMVAELATDRQGLATLRNGRNTGQNGDAQSEVCRLRADHPRPVCLFSSRKPRGALKDRDRSAAGKHATPEGSAPSRGILILPPRRG